jgi:hypothetical protein
MDVWKKDGYFAEFSSQAGINLTSPWDAGSDAVIGFRHSVTSEMQSVVSNIESNVQKAKASLSSLTSVITETATQADGTVGASYTGSSSSGGSGGGGSTAQPATPAKTLDNQILSRYNLTSSQVLALGYGPLSLEEFENLLKNYQIKYSAKYKQIHNMQAIERSLKKVLYGEYDSGPLAVKKYAQGTLGTKRDEWAITDESWIGEEITLAAGKNGQLQYLKKGSAVMPADISANLVEWGKLDPGMLNLNNPASNINIISSAIIQPNYEFNFDSLVHVDHCDEGTLKGLEKMVDNKINDFSKQLNYSIKKYAR